MARRKLGQKKTNSAVTFGDHVNRGWAKSIMGLGKGQKEIIGIG